MSQEYKIIRTATQIGNGAHVFLPKEWINQEVVITIKPKPPLKQQITKILEPYLESIKGAYLYGSYARNEAEKDSDIDLLVITNKPLKINAPNTEILSIQEENISNLSKNNPLLIPSILTEAKPVINSQLLNELKQKHKLNKEEINKFILKTEEIIKKIEDIINKDKKAQTTIPGVAYSLILRLRGVYILKKLLKNQIFSNKEFIDWLKKNIKKEELSPIIETYKQIKKDKKGKDISIRTAEKLTTLLKKELKTIQNGKKKKTP